MSWVAANQAGRARGSLTDSRYFDAGSQRIVPRQSSEFRMSAERTLTFAKPPAWTEDAKCIETAEFGKTKDKRYDMDRMTPEWAQGLCADCPIIEACLSAAMEAEGDVVARNRYGIWGGTTPAMRAELAVAAKECSKGHRGHMRRYDYGLACLECKRVNERERYAKSQEEEVA